MAIAMQLGGYTATEADLLRRTMGNIRKKSRLEAALETLEEAHAGARGSRTEATCDDEDLRGPRELRELWISRIARVELCADRVRDGVSQGALTRRSSSSGCSTRSRWVSIPCRRWCTTRSGMASRCGRPVCARAVGIVLRNETEDARCAGDAGRVALRARHRRQGDRAMKEAQQRGAVHVDRRRRRRAASSNRGDVLAFAQADAFAAWAPDRRHAAWEALRASGDVLPLAPATVTHHEPVPINREQFVFSGLPCRRHEHSWPSDGVGARAARSTAARSTAASSSRCRTAGR